MRYVKKDSLLKALDTVILATPVNKKTRLETLKEIRNGIDGIRGVEAKRVTLADWEVSSEGCVQCSECGEEVSIGEANYYSYCPYCGAEIRHGCD